MSAERPKLTVAQDRRLRDMASGDYGWLPPRREREDAKALLALGLIAPSGRGFTITMPGRAAVPCPMCADRGVVDVPTGENETGPVEAHACPHQNEPWHVTLPVPVDRGDDNAG